MSTVDDVVAGACELTTTLLDTAVSEDDNALGVLLLDEVCSDVDDDVDATPTLDTLLLEMERSEVDAGIDDEGWALDELLTVVVVDSKDEDVDDNEISELETVLLARSDTAESMVVLVGGDVRLDAVACAYRLSRSGPPHNSLLAPMHSIPHSASGAVVPNSTLPQ